MNCIVWYNALLAVSCIQYYFETENCYVLSTLTGMGTPSNLFTNYFAIYVSYVSCCLGNKVIFCHLLNLVSKKEEISVKLAVTV